MTRNLPHVKLNTQDQHDPSVVLHFNYGFDDTDNEREPDPDYTLMAESFVQDLAQFRGDLRQRRIERNPALQIPVHIEYIEITFQAQFALNKYFQPWRNTFGLEAVRVADFGTKLLFAIVDPQLANEFIQNVNHFIAKATGANAHTTYSRLLLYIKSFKLLTTTDILQPFEPAGLINIQLAELPLTTQPREQILEVLQNYLEQNGLSYSLDLQTNNLEINGATNDQIIEVVQNYDVALQITSALSTVIRPGRFNQPERSYDFEVEQPEEDLPIIAIVDTGVSAATPLAPLIMADEDLNLTNTSVNQDNTDDGRGHGTAVAALAALGKTPYRQGYHGIIPADGRILPIKIMDAESEYLSQKAVVDKMKLAKDRYPSLKIFVLTTVYKRYKRYNEPYSTYAYALDSFAYENDCLICICTGNNSDAGLHNNSYSLAYFQNEETNLCAPAESMNNLTIGAASHSLKQGTHIGIATDKGYPALYTRKGHIDIARLSAPAKENKRLFKPDVIECGGDYSFGPSGGLNDLSHAGIEVLSADPSESFFTHMGTSFSAPLVANIAARIQRKYPDLRAASIKALIVNSASCKSIAINERQRNNLAGFGFVDDEKAVFSSKNSITVVLEDSIDAEQVKIFPIHFPPYLINDDLKKSNGILYLTATLCFQFEPAAQHQQGYCPIHIAFGVFRNHTGAQIQTSEKDLQSKLKSNGVLWSQNARYKQKPTPFSNVQRIILPINRQELLDEHSTFKIAVQCRVHPQLLPGQENRYLENNLFSIALTLEENLPEQRLTGKLYAGILEVNNTISIDTLAGQAEAEAES